ncbi:Nonribosomal peptide synthetase 2 [Hypsizygus marmoreus]|uniref:Nonribosomal peptide synthetase 2 n=1 Tax=Hypsizygus marmoreus TaxID=39966 RepID=A0A369JJD9_HYPMA|nr:Nonribosomal peptide synthetase 2 [Hypsizygus marmoreus]
MPTSSATSRLELPDLNPGPSDLVSSLMEYPSPSDSANVALSDAQRLLQGYSVLEWPDLSASRQPGDTTHSVVKILSDAHTNRIPHIIAAVARVLGAYSGASDVLLAVQLGEDCCVFVRVVWTDADTWEDITSSLSRDLQHYCQSPISLASVRRVLDLNEKQWPCMALCQFSESKRFQTPPGYPLVFSYTSSDFQLSLSVSTRHAHPSVSSQIISQVATLTLRAETHPTSCISSGDDIPIDLMSVYERTTDDEILALAYPHLKLVRLATDYLAQRSVSHPESTAVRWYHDLSPEMDLGDFESITYAALHKRANQLARWLRRMGLNTEDRIAVCMARDINFHVAMMGIMRAGGCYVPIDPELPVERKAYIARDSNARFVFTSADTSPPSLFGPHTIYLDEEQVQNAIHEESDEDVEYASPDGLAFLLYTSGTTGNPKGCLLTNRGLSQALLALSSTAADVRMPPLTEGRYLAVASVAFDVHLGESFVPIALGMPLISAPRAQLLENLPFYVTKLGVTHLGIVPSLIEATMGAVQEGENAGGGMALRYIASGGEKMSDSILDKWASHPQVRLANFYGPSEATIGCCARYMDSTTPRANIGRPFANVSGYVVGPNMNILLRGGVGELVVEGPLVGRGYHGRPDLTEKVFMEWPQKGRWAYRTGDLVRMMPDSTLEILGRIDTQIKLRGVRIESEGISSIIRRAAPSSSNFSLDAATVLAKHPSIGTEQLVSFVTWDPAVSVSTRKSQIPIVISPPEGLMEKIKTVCEVELARYMRPSHIIPLSWLPLSSNGKSDAKVLVGIFNRLTVDALVGLMASMNEKDSQTRSATKQEEEVFMVLTRHTTMPLTRARPDINIFECGLDSMAIIRFAMDLKKTFGQRVSASDIMLSPTLSGISSLLHRSTSSTTAPTVSYTEDFASRWSNEVESIYTKSDLQCILPPFSVQEGVLSRSADHTTMYVQHVIVACESSISLSGLRGAWQAVVERAPILRTVFHFSSALVQVVLHSGRFDLPWSEDETSITDPHTFVSWFLTQRAADTAREINENISGISPFRLCAYLSPGPMFFVLSIHHALYDGISLPILMQDVEREYCGHPPRSAANLSNILDQMAATDLAKAQCFWVDHFRGFAWPSTPLHLTDNAPTQRKIIQLASRLTSLKELAASQQVTLQALFTCTFAKIVATRVYHTSDVSFGVIRSGRLLPVEHIESAMCPMVSVVPTRVNFGASGNVLHTIQNQISAMVEVEHVALGKVQSWVRPGKPLFDLLFSVSVKDSTPSSIWDVIESQPPEADYILAVEVVLDLEHDKASIQAAWKAGDLDEVLVHEVLDEFEGVVLDLGSGVTNSFIIHSGSPSPELYSSTTEEYADEAEDEPEGLVDPELLIQLRHILSDFLGINEKLITETTSFISLGLDSIKSVGLARALKKLGHIVPAIDLMKYSTLRRLANRITSPDLVAKGPTSHIEYSQVVDKLRKSFILDSAKLFPEDVVTVFPTTSLQAGMLSQTVSSNGALYVHAFPLRLSSDVVIEKLQEAWKKTVDSLDILRTSFHFVSELGVWAQAVHTSSIFDWTVDTFSTVEEYDKKVLDYLTSIRPKDENAFCRPPVWIRVYNASPQSVDQASRLVLVMHHALYDGLSIGKLFDLVKSLYRGTEIEPPVQFSTLLRHFVQQEATGALFWARVLNAYHYIPLPRQIQSGHDGCSYTVSRNIPCDPHLLDATLSHAAVTAQCLGQAVWAKLIAELSGSPDVVFGHVVSGRSIPGAENVIGPVLNTIPCRIRLQGGLHNTELLRSIHLSNVNALPWQQASLRSIQQKLRIAQLWDSLFLFQPLEPVDSDPGQLWMFDDANEEDAQIQYALNVEMHQHQSGFTIMVASQPDYMDLIGLEKLLERFQTLLQDLISHPEASVLDDTLKKRFATFVPTTQQREQHISCEQIPGPIQRLLANITSIPADQFTPSTPLISLGIDSITAIQIVSQFRRAGMKLTTNDIITSRTVDDMVQKITVSDGNLAQSEKKSVLEVSAMEKAAILARLDCDVDAVESVMIASSGMKWLIGSWQRSERSAFQHAFAYRLPDGFDIAKLRAAWSSLLERLVLLRSTFACAKGNREPRIVTFKPGAYPEEWTEEEAGDASILELLASRMKELVSSPPPTSRPPTRAVLLHSPQRAYLVIHLHHFQYDAWSLPLILDDLSQFYHGSEPVTTNNTWSFLQVAGPTPKNLEVQKQYWETTFPKHFDPVLLPSFIPSSSPTTERVIYTAKAAITKAALCEERARSLQVSLPAVFLACWAQIQAKYMSSEFTTVGLWQAGRSGLLDDIERLASPCSNIVPMYISGLSNSNTIEVALAIQDDLRARSAVIVQSDLVEVDKWVGAQGRPLSNVVVNIVRVAPDVKKEESWLEQVEMPYFVPGVPPAESTSTVERLAITDLIQNDLILDFAVLPADDTILMSVDAAAHFMDKERAKELVKDWVTTVMHALGSSEP